MMRKRLSHVLHVLCLLCVVGVAYGIFFLQTGIGLMCPVHFLTGWKCPGCGVTHMCASLLRLDFAGAFAANPALLLLSPVFALLFLKYTADYVRTGRWQMSPLQNAIIWICIIILLFYGVCRNVFPIP